MFVINKHSKMKTNQLMIRDLDGYNVEQRTDNSYLNATDLLKIYNEKSSYSKRFADFLNNKNTDDFIDALIAEENLKVVNSPLLKSDLIIVKRGKYGSTFMHPYLFIKFAMWLSPEFEVKVIKWVYDNLIKTRNEAGDHYIEMAETIKESYFNYFDKKPDPLVFIKEANFLKQLAFGHASKQRNEASEFELKLLNALQLANIKLIKESTPKDIRHNKLRDFARMYS